MLTRRQICLSRFWLLIFLLSGGSGARFAQAGREASPRDSDSDGAPNFQPAPVSETAPAVLVLKGRHDFIRVNELRLTDALAQFREKGNAFSGELPLQTIDYILYAHPREEVVRLRRGYKLKANFSHRQGSTLVFTNATSAVFLENDGLPPDERGERDLAEGLSAGSAFEKKEKNVIKFIVDQTDLREVHRAQQWGAGIFVGFAPHIDGRAGALNNGAWLGAQANPRRPLLAHGLFGEGAWPVAFRFDGARFSDRQNTEDGLTLLRIGVWSGPQILQGPSWKFQILASPAIAYLSGQRKNFTSLSVTFSLAYGGQFDFRSSENLSLRLLVANDTTFQSGATDHKQTMMLGLGAVYYP